VKRSSDQLLRSGHWETENFLFNRRLAASLTAIGMVSLSIIALYQLGVLKNLPEPRLPGLDAEKVNGSPEAYAILQTPDALLGLGSYATTLALATAGKVNRAEVQPWIPLSLAAKAGLDLFVATALTRKSWIKFRAFSLYSLVVAFVTCLTFPTVLPEARSAWLHLKDRL
jgi:hypothetical protein